MNTVMAQVANKAFQQNIEADVGNYNEQHAAINSLNLDKLKWKLSKSSEATWTEELIDFAEEEYKKFLFLKLIYPKVALVPNKLVDKFWHEHILDTVAYQKDCEAIFGYFIHHYPYFGIYGDDDQRSLQTAFDETVALYEKHFGKYPTDVLYGANSNKAARCGDDHACHAPSSCACRVPGACK
ncbi:glycine-rich domain-containing protein [Alteromonas sp. S005]|uniref:glycine-rich domain-containing protein n=1 Tax=Alteromonas sp. S005 TaxID=3117400 RepID=UPI002FE1E0AE